MSRSAVSYQLSALSYQPSAISFHRPVVTPPATQGIASSLIRWHNRPIMSTVRIQLDLFGVVKREGNWHIAHCPSLDVTTQGRTLEEAKKNLIEACELFLTSCLERGTLEQAFRELGVTPAKVAKPIPRHAFPIAINVPLAFQRQSLCPA